MRHPTFINDDAFPGPFSENQSGLTKREYLAAMCLQGILANPQFDDDEEKARSAVNYADLLIEALNKE